MGQTRCPQCFGDTVYQGLNGPMMCPTCGGQGHVWAPDVVSRRPPPRKLSKVQTPEKSKKEKVQVGASYIAIVLAGGSFLLAVTSSLSFGAVVVLTLVVFAAMYFTFTHSLAFISSVLMALVYFFFGAVTLSLKVGAYLLGAVVFLYVAFGLVT